MLDLRDKIALAYITGAALGDGNLSRVSRATRLRISCDLKYPNIIKEIYEKLRIISPNNPVNSTLRKGNCLDIYCYSNDWENVLGWKVGDKLVQKVCVPDWIFKEKNYMVACLKGLLQTDGSIYFDRGYKMVNFVNSSKNLAVDVFFLISKLGFYPNFTAVKPKNQKMRYTARVCKDCEKFINYIGLTKD